MIAVVLDTVVVEILPPATVEESDLPGTEIGSPVDEQLKLTMHRSRVITFPARIRPFEEQTLTDHEDDARRLAIGRYRLDVHVADPSPHRGIQVSLHRTARQAAATTIRMQ